MGPTEAAAIVTFWRREFEGMRVKGCVDWSTAYTLWRNMLVDYESPVVRVEPPAAPPSDHVGLAGPHAGDVGDDERARHLRA